MAATSEPTSQDWARFASGTPAGVQLMSAHFLKHEFERHSHAEFSIGVTRSGVQSYSAGGSQHHSLPSNIMVFNPEVAHDGKAGDATGFGYQMVYIEPQLVAAWCTDYFADGATRYGNQTLLQDAAIARCLQTAFAALAQPQESLRAHTLLSSGVVQLLARHGGAGSVQQLHRDTPHWIGLIQDYIQENYACDITSDDLTALAGVSRIHLNRVFTKATGIPPHAYLNAIRIRHAKQHLQAGASAADVAVQCGFADQSHLIRRFKGSLGITPNQWQRANNFVSLLRPG